MYSQQKSNENIYLRIYYIQKVFNTSSKMKV